MRRHRIIMVVWIGLSLFLMIFSYSLGLGNLNQPGSGLVPFLIAVSLFQIAFWSLIISLLRRGAVDERLEEKKKVNFVKLGFVIALLILYGAFLEILGFPIVTFLFLLSLFRIMGVRLSLALAGSAFSVLASYIGFTFLGVRFPAGILRTIGL